VEDDIFALGNTKSDIGICVWICKILVSQEGCQHMKMIAYVCIPRSRRVALGNSLSHKWLRCVVDPAMRLAQHRSRQPRLVPSSFEIATAGGGKDLKNSVQIHEHLQNGDCQRRARLTLTLWSTWSCCGRAVEVERRNMFPGR